MSNKSKKKTAGGESMRERRDERVDLESLPPVLKVKELSQLLRIPLTRTYELIEKGEIPCIRLGRSIRIPRSVVSKLLDADNHGKTS